MAKNSRIKLQKGEDAHTLVVRLLKSGVDKEKIRKASGQPKKAIDAIQAHITMGSY